jgi:hypothetical protein
VVNGDFETGSLAGWTTFVTPGGTLGTPGLPDVVSFDVDGDASTSLAARFMVGGAVAGGSGGGGIFQNFVTTGGLVSVTANVASFASQRGNFDGGLFTLQIDGTDIDSVFFNDIGAGSTRRATLGGSLLLGAGTHELRFVLFRIFGIGDLGVTPFQFIDDVRLTQDDVAAVPEPGSLLLLASGLAGFTARMRKRRSEHGR